MQNRRSKFVCTDTFFFRLQSSFKGTHTAAASTSSLTYKQPFSATVQATMFPGPWLNTNTPLYFSNNRSQSQECRCGGWCKLTHNPSHRTNRPTATSLVPVLTAKQPARALLLAPQSVLYTDPCWPFSLSSEHTGASDAYASQVQSCTTDTVLPLPG